MTIRFAELKDKQQVLALLDELGHTVNERQGHSSKNTEAQMIGSPIYEEIMNRKDTLIFVAEENGELIGAATFYILPNIRHGFHRGHIEDFIVSEKARGKGVGSTLIQEIKNYCKQHKITVIKLDSEKENIASHTFYEKNGGKNTEIMFRFDL